MIKDDPGWVRLPLAWFVHLPLVSKLLLFFGCIFLLSGLFGLLPSRPVFSVRLICLGLTWDYFFRLQIASVHKEEYHDGSVERKVSIDWSRLMGGIFFLALAAAPAHYWVWVYRRLSS